VFKWVLIVLGVIVVLVGGGSWFVMTSDSTKGLRDQAKERFEKREESIEVQLSPVVRGSLTRRVGAPGTIEPRTKVEISAQVSARITALPKREGDLVEPGDVVVRMDARDLIARRDASLALLTAEEARLEGARARHTMVSAEYDRRKQLLESGDISMGEMERAESDYLSSTSELRIIEANINAQRAEILVAERDLENSVIVSPIHGLVTRLEAEVGELAVVGTLNNPGSVIMELADLQDMLVQARVDESNVAVVEPGQVAAIFVNAYGDEPFSGIVERVGLTRKRWEDGSYYYETEITVPFDESRPLRSGMTAAVELDVETFDAVLKVPSQAVMDRRIDELPSEIVEASANANSRKTFARVVYRVVDGRTVVTPVTIGPSDLTHTVILGGLSEDDQVITGPYRELLTLTHDKAAVEEGSVESGADEPVDTASQGTGSEQAVPVAGSGGGG
jgi:HlyD family secretion protein